jgi:hypothetical protein
MAQLKFESSTHSMAVAIRITKERTKIQDREVHSPNIEGRENDSDACESS